MGDLLVGIGGVVVVLLLGGWLYGFVNAALRTLFGGDY